VNRSKPRIVVVGSSNTDLIARLDRLPQPGETRLSSSFETAAGGKGANQAVAAARAGGRVSLVARVGRDAFGDQALVGFRRAHLQVDHVYRDRVAPSGVALIYVGARGENCIAVASGANARLSPKDVRQARRTLEQAQVLLLQLEIPLATVQLAAQIASAAGVIVVLNPAPVATLPETLLRRVTYLSPNESEASRLTGLTLGSESSVAKAATQLRDRGVGTVIITLGARGAFVSGQGHHQRVPSFRVRAVDTVAAGDVFNGALAVALGEDQPLLEAVRFAGKITRPTGSARLPKGHDLRRRRRQSRSRGLGLNPRRRLAAKLFNASEATSARRQPTDSMILAVTNQNRTVPFHEHAMRTGQASFERVAHRTIATLTGPNDAFKRSPFRIDSTNGVVLGVGQVHRAIRSHGNSFRA